MRRSLLFIFCLLLSGIDLFGDCKCVTENGEAVLIKGITLIPAGSELENVPRKEGIQVYVRDVYIDGVIRYLRRFINCPLNGDTVKDIKNELVKYFEREKIFAVAIVPEQEVTDQIVLVEILLSRIGKLTFDGQKCFPACLFERGMHLRSGEILNQEQMLNNLAFLNRNPFHYTTMVLSPGERVGTTDIDFHTDDRFPWRFYVGADNTGVKQDDMYRLFGGVTWGNAFCCNDLMTYQYTCSPNIYQFQSHLLSYLSYLPSKNILLFYGLYGIVHPNITGYTSSGKAAQISMRYQKLCRPLYVRRKSFWEVGFNYKFLNNNLFFEGTTSELPLVQEAVNINELVAGFDYSNYWPGKQVTFEVELFASIWQNLFENQNNASYQKLRSGALVYFAYLNGSAGYHREWKSKWVFSAYLAAQVATGALLSSEQFVLGGMDSVRGYLQAQFLSDNAFNWNLELYAPPFKVYKYPATVLVFWDFGYGYNYHALSSQTDNQYLSGLGFGIRYHIRSYFSFRADYGFQLHTIPGGTNLGQAYFSIIASY